MESLVSNASAAGCSGKPEWLSADSLTMAGTLQVVVGALAQIRPGGQRLRVHKNKGCQQPDGFGAANLGGAWAFHPAPLAVDF